MTRFAVALWAALAATSVSAQQRPSTPMLSCAQARGIVAQQGAAVLGTGGYTFDRFVSSRRFCEVTEVTRTTFVPTRDNPQCFVGYRCIEPSPDDWFGDR